MIRFPNIQKKNISKNYPELAFKFPSNKKQDDIGGKFKFQAQDSFFGIFFLEIWRFKQRIALSEKKTFSNHAYYDFFKQKNALNSNFMAHFKLS